MVDANPDNELLRRMGFYYWRPARHQDT
jgi:hypothetical protein